MRGQSSCNECAPVPGSGTTPGSMRTWDSSTPTSQCNRSANKSLRRFLDCLDLEHGQKEPYDGHINREACKLIAGPRAEWAGPPCASQGSDQAAPLAALDQDQKDHKQADQ